MHGKMLASSNLPLIVAYDLVRLPVASRRPPSDASRGIKTRRLKKVVVHYCSKSFLREMDSLNEIS
jgi:hypothetical protein